jgi:uncharacterized membrane protein YecN with MAPEG domain
MESVTITPIYAALLGLILLALSVRVVAVVRAKVGLGDGGNPDYVTVIRGQGNFIEYVPMIVILLGFAEAGGTSDGLVHTMGAALVLGRILHPIGLTTKDGINPFRFSGTILTFGVLLVVSILVLVNQLG